MSKSNETGKQRTWVEGQGKERREAAEVSEGFLKGL